MDVKCVFCEMTAGINDIHAHMVEAHTDQVTTEFDEETEKMRYIIQCPLCDLKYQHRIKPRYRNPAFLEEYKREIALVAFDQLLYHLAQAHGEEVGINLDNIEIE